MLDHDSGNRVLKEPAEWLAFLKREARKTIGSYRAKPELLLRDLNDENHTVGDYAGREILELLQNAADAAAERGERAAVLFELTGDALIAANTGQPFRTGGVASLLTAHLSDKPRRSSKLIGAKGLGFRALLNWTDEMFVCSGGLSLAFSRSHARVSVQRLAARCPGVADLLCETAELPSPVMPFPRFGSELSETESDSAARVLKRCKALQQDGFDTVIGIPFNSLKARERAERQLDELHPTFLLFVPNLKSLTIERPGLPCRSWEAERSGRDACLRIGSGTESRSETWECHDDAGELPPRAGRRADESSQYQVTVAFRCDADQPPSVLHSYFPTKLSLPLPALCHATLALVSNRDQMQMCEDNALVLDKLAELYVHAAALRAAESPARRHEALDLIRPRSPFHESLAGFEQRLLYHAAARPVVPTLGGELLRPAQTLLAPGDGARWLPSRLFPSVADVRNTADTALLRQLKVGALSDDAFKTAVRSAGELSVPERAGLVCGAVRDLPACHLPDLLVDREDRPFAAGETSFPPPSGAQPPPLPPWARTRFIRDELWSAIAERLALPPRERLAKLKPFGVVEYDLATLVRELARQAEVAIIRGGEEEECIRLQLLDVLARLWAREAKPPQFPSDVHIKLRSRAGSWRAARELHLGSGFGQAGEIVESLYASLPQALVDRGSLPEQDRAFALWLGTHEWPRPVASRNDQDFWAHISSQLGEEVPVVDDNGRIESLPRLTLALGSTAELTAHSVAGLDVILKADPYAIWAWVALDPRFEASAAWNAATRLRAKRASQFNLRDYRSPLPTYLSWRVARAEWLPTTEGRKAPVRTLREPGRLSDLFGRPVAPRPEIADRFGVGRELWLQGLSKAGVPANLEELGEAEIYRLLGSLEKKGVSHPTARALYQQVVELRDFASASAGAAAALFKEGGRLSGRVGTETRWFDVGDLLYVDFDGAPASLRDELPLLNLPTRRGARQVSDRLGVRPLSRRDARETVARSVPAPQVWADFAESRFDEVKPYLKAFRLQASEVVSSLRRLEALRVHTVASLETEVSFEGRTYRGTLDPWTHYLDGDRLYLVVDASVFPEVGKDLLADGVGAGVAELFNLQGGADFARLFACSRDARRVLLRRLLGNEDEATLDELLAQILPPDPPEFFSPAALDAVVQTAEHMVRPPEGVPADPTTATPPAPEPGVPARGTPPPVPSPAASPSSPPPPPQPAVPASVEFVQVDSQPAEAPTTTPLKIATAWPSWPGAPRDPGKANDAEGWALLFEERAGRYPVYVGHITGEEAFGCDIVSFGSEEARQRFKAGRFKEARDVVRWIEVKSGAVRLTRNAAKAAQRLKDQYFVYRITFEDGRDRCTLVALSDPLNRPGAVEHDVVVYPERSPDHLAFAVSRNDDVVPSVVVPAGAESASADPE